MPGLSSLIIPQDTGPQGHLHSKEGQDSGTGLGPPAVHHTIEFSMGNTLWHSPRHSHLSWAFYWERWPDRYLLGGGCRGRADDLLEPCIGVWKLRAEPGSQEEQATALHTCDWPEEASELKGAVSLGLMVITQRWLPPTPPVFLELLATKSGSPPLKDLDSLVGLPYRAWLYLTSLGSVQMVITQRHLDVWVTILLWDQGHFPDIPAFNFAWLPSPIWHPKGTGGTMSKWTTLNPKEDPKLSEYLLIKPNKTWS